MIYDSMETKFNGRNSYTCVHVFVTMLLHQTKKTSESRIQLLNVILVFDQ